MWASGSCQEYGIVLVGLKEQALLCRFRWGSGATGQFLACNFPASDTIDCKVIAFVSSFLRAQPEVLKAKKSLLQEMKEEFEGKWSP